MQSTDQLPKMLIIKFHLLNIITSYVILMCLFYRYFIHSCEKVSFIFFIEVLIEVKIEVCFLLACFCFILSCNFLFKHVLQPTCHNLCIFALLIFPLNLLCLASCMLFIIIFPDNGNVERS